MKIEKKNQFTTAIKENSFGWLLKTLNGKFDKKILELLKSHELNVGQFAVLLTLFEEDGITQSEIGKRLFMPGYATTRNIDVLESQGLLERQKDESSRRSFCIRLTKKGEDKGPILLSIRKDINKQFLKPLTEQEQQQLKKLLQKLLFSQ